jgi:putative sigma-54 modulation protein
MEVYVRSRKLAPLTGLHEYAKEQVLAATDYFTEQVQSITVRVEDINGPKGGVDAVCRVVARIKGRASVVVHSVAAKPGAAVHAAAEQLFIALERRLHRAPRRKLAYALSA